MIGTIIYYPVSSAEIHSKYAVVIKMNEDDTVVISPFTRWGWPSTAYKAWRVGRWAFIKDYYGVRKDYPHILLCPICEIQEGASEVLSIPLRRRKDNPYWKGPDHYQCKRCRRNFYMDGTLKEVTK